MSTKDVPVKGGAPKGMTVAEDGSFRFAEGNQLWKLALRNGLQPKLYLDPNDLVIAICGYFQWVEDNPLQEAKLVTYEGNSTLEGIPKMRAPTLAGLTAYIGISRTTWGDWRRGTTRPELSHVVEWAEQFMYESKFTGASAGLLNAMMISRDLGLIDKQEVTGPNGGPQTIVHGEMTTEDAAEAYALTREQSKG